MDPTTFDDLAIRLFRGIDRRGALHALRAALFGATLGGSLVDLVPVAAQPRRQRQAPTGAEGADGGQDGGVAAAVCHRLGKKCDNKRGDRCCANAKCRGGKCRCNGKKACHGRCIPKANCCDSADCAGGATCQGGHCLCPAGEKDCQGACIPADDCCTTADCGACESCQRGACVSGCRDGQECQDGVCRCTAASCPDGCCDGDECEPGDRTGACGTGGAACTECRGGTTCQDGACKCPAGEKECAGRCIPAADCCRNADCGACESCQRGACVSGCQPGQACRDGRCACTPASCSTGCCDGDDCLPGDRNGACGSGGEICVECGGGTTCQDGACKCRSGEKDCAGRCIPAADCCDNGDCGACESCRRGECVSGCRPGQACRDGRCTCTRESCSTGCCAGDTCEAGDGDRACGRGGNACAACPANADCVGGACRCDVGFQPCQGTCIRNDECCGDGGCGQCTICQRGRCVPLPDLPPTCCARPGGGAGVCRDGACAAAATLAQCGGRCDATVCDGASCPRCSSCEGLGCDEGGGTACDGTKYCISELADPLFGCLGGCNCPAGTACSIVYCYKICTGA
jgi:hypothetical protein